METLLKNAEIIDAKKIDFDKIHMGCKVKVRDMKTRREMIYEIVPSTEVNSREKKISYESPIGAALMNQEVGVVVKIEIPAGTLRYKILEIQKAEV